ncbi:MAG: hypothetical protein IT556_03570 [Acetobacteraceae bacterium]|nr:hypothetical protein [Acetobacteraceae bacterium]
MPTDNADKPRTLRRQIALNPDTLPPEPDPARLPRLATRDQLATIHARYFGPLSPRTIEALPLPYRRPPGSPALYEVGPFLEWARQRLEAAPVLIGGRRRKAA